LRKFDLSNLESKLNRVQKEFSGKVAQIGFPKGEEYPDGTSVAYVATIHEYGAPEANIPPRPFFYPTIAEKKRDWVKLIEDDIADVIMGNKSVDDVLELVGIVAHTDIQEKIESITSPKLSPITIQRKGSEKPLIDTGYMHSSVTSKVAKAGDEFVKGKQ